MKTEDEKPVAPIVIGGGAGKSVMIEAPIHKLDETSVVVIDSGMANQEKTEAIIQRFSRPLPEIDIIHMEPLLMEEKGKWYDRFDKRKRKKK